MNAPIHNRENKAPADGWYQIEVTGTHPAGDGRRQVIDEEALASIVERFRSEASGGDFAGMLVDADHLSHDPARDTAALAWLKELEIRNGELHGRLELTDLGEAAVKGKRYKYFSTEYAPRDLEELPGGEVRPRRLAGLAMTNRPNNRGGKPISNREDDARRDNTETKDDMNMQAIAEKLGLSAEATEADILSAIEDLQGQVAEMASKEAEAEADAVLNRLGERVPEAARPHWREQLIANRESAEKLLVASFPEPKGGERIFNRGTASPKVAEQRPGGGDKADEQAALVSQIRNRDRCTHTQAWDQARRERPDLF